MSTQNDFTDYLTQRYTTNGLSGSDAARLAAFGAAQAAGESAYNGVGYSSPAYLATNNCIGYGYYQGSPWQNGTKYATTDDVGTLAGYNSLQDCANELADWVSKYDNASRLQAFLDCQNINDYAVQMVTDGYCTGQASAYSALISPFYSPVSDIVAKVSALAPTVPVGLIIGAAAALLALLTWLGYELTKKRS